MNDMREIFGEVISEYTRAQAVEDGVLVDVSKLAYEAGFKWPVAVTRAVYDRYIAVPEELKGQQDENGRTWDILWMMWVNVRTGKITGSQGEFKLLVRLPESAEWQTSEARQDEDPRLRLITLKSVSGPGDNGEPVITIMLPFED